MEVKTTVEDLFGKPEFVTGGCYRKVLKENDDKMLSYHSPLESNKNRQLWLAEKKKRGKQMGHRVYLNGLRFELIELGREEDFKEEIKEERKSVK